MKAVLTRLMKDEAGASLAEYGLLIALIAVVCVGAITAAGLAIKAKFNEVTTNLGGTAAP